MCMSTPSMPAMPAPVKEEPMPQNVDPSPVLTQETKTTKLDSLRQGIMGTVKKDPLTSLSAPDIMKPLAKTKLGA